MTQEQEAPQIAVTDADWQELLNRMPMAKAQITIIAQERTLLEQQAKIKELESKNSEFVLDEFKRKDDEKKVKAV